jgi:hypothetical protein
LLDRFLAGDAGADEVRAVRDWLAADPARGAVLAELQRVRAVVGHPPPPRGVDAAWTDLLSALRAAPDE